MLTRSVDSLINQEYKNLEILLIDDGSAQEVADVCDEICSRDCRIKVIHKENGGVSSARNMGLDIAQGEFIGFIDSDDYVDTNFFKVLVEEISKTNSDIAISDVIYEFENGDIFKSDERTGFKELNQSQLFEKTLSSEKVGGYLWNKLFKKELIARERLDEKLHYCEDFEFVARYLKRCQKGVFCGDTNYHYYKNNDSITNGMKYNSKIFSILTAYEKIKQIYLESASSQISEIEKNMFFMSLNLRERYRATNSKNIYEYKVINKTIRSNFANVMLSNKLTLYSKIYVIVRLLGVAGLKKKISKILSGK